jgi:hypothetical protein
MKKIISNIILLNLAVLLLFSCKKDESTQVVAKATATPGALTASQTTLVLTKANATQSAISFTLTDANYGFSAAAKNTIQIAKKGTNFATPKEISLEAKITSKAYTVIDFNALMLTLGLPTGIASDIEARVVSKVADAIAPVYSNVVAIKVTPYALISYIYAVGEFSGWNEKNPDSLISATSNGIYTGVLDYRPSTSKAFLILPAKSWSNKYADAGGGKLSYNSGSDIIAPTSEQYRVTADLNALTIVFEKHWWGITGDATPTGWGSDTQMKYNNGTQTWSSTISLIGGKYIKFKQTSDWSLTNYGSKTANGNLDTEGGNDIPVATTGTYKVTLDIINKTYTLIKQ